MDAAEYKHVVLGLIFLTYISDVFEAKHAKLEAQKEDAAPFDVKMRRLTAELEAPFAESTRLEDAIRQNLRSRRA
jgi:type I restriction-modification system DNA methylase subunit